MKIVFVCTGNMSRSPFAECVLRQMLHERGIEGVEESSVGTSYLEQSPRDPMMVEMAAKYGYRMGGMAVYMTPDELNSADVVLIMSRKHHNKVTSTLNSSHWDRIHLFLDYCCGIDEDVPDPYFGTESLYRRVCERIIAACNALADKISAGKLSY